MLYIEVKNQQRQIEYDHRPALNIWDEVLADLILAYLR